MPNIIGLGIDATDIHRIAAAIERYGDRFQRGTQLADHAVAGGKHRRGQPPAEGTRFTISNAGAMYQERYWHEREFDTVDAFLKIAKEAGMKALGTGHSYGVLWRHLEVVRRGGPPQLQFHGGAARRLEAIRGRSSLLTITHSENLAIAQVIILGE